MAVWTTDGVQQNQRFDLWQGQICRSINNVSADCVERQGFKARLIARSHGQLKLAWFHTGEHHIVRTLKHIRAEGDHPYIISLQLVGRTSIIQGDAAFHLDADEIAIVDTNRPFELQFSSDVERIVAVLPRASIESRIPWLKRCHTLKIEKDAPYGELSRSHIRELVAQESKRDIEASLLVENICNLLTLATREAQPDQLDKTLQLELIMSYCRDNIANPRLSPSMVAAQFGISLRTLHGRFEQIGQSFTDWMLERRLDVCSRALHDPAQSRRSITEIVYQNGFNDLSHFCRIFKRRFGLTAREWRSQKDRSN